MRRNLFAKLALTFLALLLSVLIAVDFFAERALRRDYERTGFAQLASIAHFSQLHPPSAAALLAADSSDPALRERSFGQAQGRPHGELPAATSGIDIDRVVDAGARPAEGESLTELYERVATFIDELGTRAPEGDVLVVTHGGVIRVAQAYCNGIPAAGMAWGPVPNASVWGLRRPHPSIATAR